MWGGHRLLLPLSGSAYLRTPRVVVSRKIIFSKRCLSSPVRQSTLPCAREQACVGACVGIYVHMYIYMCVGIRIDRHVWICGYVCVCMHGYVGMCKCACMDVWVCMSNTRLRECENFSRHLKQTAVLLFFICAINWLVQCVWMHVYGCMCVHVWMQVWMQVWIHIYASMDVCVCKHACVLFLIVIFVFNNM